MPTFSAIAPILIALGSFCLYGITNTILEQKLSQYPTGVLMVCFYGGMLPLALIRLGVMKFSGDAIAWPLAGSALVWMLIGAVGSFMADYMLVASYTKAYAQGAEYLASIVGVGLLLPVFANGFKRLWVGHVHLTGYHIAAYAFGGVSILFIILGSLAQIKKEQAAKPSSTETAADGQPQAAP